MLKAIDQTACYTKDLSEQPKARFILSVGLQHYGTLYLWVDEVYVLTNGLLKAVRHEDGVETTVLTFPGVSTWFLLNPDFAELLSNEQLYEMSRSNAADGHRMVREMERLLKQLKEQNKSSWSEDNE